MPSALTGVWLGYVPRPQRHPARPTQTGCTERPVRFVHRGRITEVRGADTTRTLLDWLRNEDAAAPAPRKAAPRATAAPAPCWWANGEGDGVRWSTVNACIQFLPMLDGKALLTVEDLRPACGGALHPAQQAMVDCHGSQCGFCTPGFVMSLAHVYERDTARAAVRPRGSSWPTTWRATCAAAPATGPSWTPAERMFDAAGRGQRLDAATCGFAALATLAHRPTSGADTDARGARAVRAPRSVASVGRAARSPGPDAQPAGRVRPTSGCG
jgi:xanthine dehydrogenase small subunit